MARELQNRVLELIEVTIGASLEREVSPSWLLRPGREEAAELWPTIGVIYGDLTGADLPDVMPLRERRSIDAVLVGETVAHESWKSMKCNTSHRRAHKPSPSTQQERQPPSTKTNGQRGVRW